jgi:hypothetical protein
MPQFLWLAASSAAYSSRHRPLHGYWSMLSEIVRVAFLTFLCQNLMSLR